MIVLLLLLAQDVATLSQTGAQAMRESRFADAESAYRQLARLEPANPMWRMNLGLALHSGGRPREALTEFDAFLKAKPEPGPVHFLAGVTRLKLHQACEAIALLEKARKWDAGKSLNELGDAYYGCNRFENAARAYEAALTAVGPSPKVARQAAHCYWRARLYPEAKRLYAGIATEFGAEPEFNYEYGDTLARQDGAEAGLPFLLRAAQAAPTLPGARSEAGKALLALNRAREAIPHLEAASAADPTLLLPLSRAYRQVGQKENADRTEREYRKRVGEKP